LQPPSTEAELREALSNDKDLANRVITGDPLDEPLFFSRSALRAQQQQQAMQLRPAEPPSASTSPTMSPSVSPRMLLAGHQTLIHDPPSLPPLARTGEVSTSELVSQVDKAPTPMPEEKVGSVEESSVKRPPPVISKRCLSFSKSPNPTLN